MITQEEKQLLLKDLYARLLYGVKVIRYTEHNNEIKGLVPEMDLSLRLLELFIGNPEFIIKPYLRSMSSMTEEEQEEYWNVVNLKSPEMPVGEIPSIETIAQCSTVVLDWLLSKGFDVRGLIPMGLALEATEGMYKN